MSDENDKGIPGSFKHGYGLDIHKRNDSLSCKQAMQTVYSADKGDYGGTTMTGIVQVFVNASDGSTYAFSSTGSIFSRSGDSQWLFVYNDENGGITGAAEWETNDGLNYLLWATASAISRKPLPGANTAPDTGTMRWSDVESTYKVEFVSSSAAWHTMSPIAGALYIANKESLASLDYAGNWNPRVMNLRPGNVIKALEERDDYVIMGSTREDGSEEGHIWSWVVSSIDYIQKKRIPVQGINALVHTELPLLQGGTDGEIFFSDFIDMVALNAVPGGGQCNPSGTAIENDLAMFGMYGGTYPGIWSYGRKRKNRPFGLNLDYRLVRDLAGSTISTIGAVTVINGVLLSSWGTTDGSTSEYGIDEVSSTLKATGVYEGLEFNAGSPHVKKKFNNVKLTLEPLPSGTSVSVKYKLNNDTSWKYGVLADRTTTFSTVNATAAYFNLGNSAEVYEVGTELNPTGNTTAEVKSITTFIDDTMTEF